MATSPKKTQKEVTKTAAAPVAERPEPKAQPLVATASAAMFESDAGSGMEGTDSESFAIPFLMVLQKGSPQVDEAAGEAIEGAKAGMLFENVTSRMFDGKVGVNIVPCAYRRVFLRWGPRGTQQLSEVRAGRFEIMGFAGNSAPDHVDLLHAMPELLSRLLR